MEPSTSDTALVPANLIKLIDQNGRSIFVEPRSGFSFHREQVQYDLQSKELSRVNSFKEFAKRSQNLMKKQLCMRRSLTICQHTSITLPVINAKDKNVAVTIYRNDLRRVKVIGQLASSCILLSVLSSGGDKVIVAVDQHGVHERIRFEQSLSRLRFKDYDIERTFLLPSIQVKIDFQSIGNQRSKESILMDLKGHYGIVARFLDTTLVVDQIPSVLSPNKLTKELAQELIQKSKAHSENGLDVSLIKKWAADNACHGAIRFGEKLSSIECQQLIAELSLCFDPFHCAHGRAIMSAIVKIR